MKPLLEGIEYKKKETVEMCTVDDFVFGRENLSGVDFMKIDTEGYERQIIKGATETIKKFKPVIICSGYHLPDDEKIIPEIVLKMNPSYRFRTIDRGEKDIIFY
jgi:hypothetical protein